jgi:hypothetical protein
MIEPTLKQLEAIAALSSDKSFLLLISWIKESADELMKNSVTVKEELQIRWNQGRLQNMNDILSTIDEVFTLLEAHKNYVPSGMNPDI